MMLIQSMISMPILMSRLIVRCVIDLLVLMDGYLSNPRPSVLMNSMLLTIISKLVRFSP
jgi:hypothetical protein